jgi:hypothetical protein
MHRDLQSFRISHVVLLLRLAAVVSIGISDYESSNSADEMSMIANRRLPEVFAALRRGQYFVSHGSTGETVERLFGSLRLRGVNCGPAGA